MGEVDVSRRSRRDNTARGARDEKREEARVAGPD